MWPLKHSQRDPHGGLATGRPFYYDRKAGILHCPAGGRIENQAVDLFSVLILRGSSAAGGDAGQKANLRRAVRISNDC